MDTHTVDTTEYPRIEVQRCGTRQVKFWCEHCRSWHCHGWPTDEQEGQRVAHCHDERSPYLRGGYILVVKEEA